MIGGNTLASCWTYRERTDGAATPMTRTSDDRDACAESLGPNSRAVLLAVGTMLAAAAPA